MSFDLENPSQHFESKFDQGLAKIYRLHYLISQCHQARMSDEHMNWKSSLDAIYSELKPYLNEEKDGIIKMDEKQKECTKQVLNLIKWENSNIQAGVKEHVKQQKQVEVEIVLDKFQYLLVCSMRNHGLDMPGQRDPSRVVLQSTY